MQGVSVVMLRAVEMGIVCVQLESALLMSSRRRRSRSRASGFQDAYLLTVAVKT